MTDEEILSEVKRVLRLRKIFREKLFKLSHEAQKVSIHRQAEFLRRVGSVERKLARFDEAIVDLMGHLKEIDQW